MQTDRLVMANEPEIVVVDKQRKTAVVIDIVVLSNGNIRKKEHVKLEKCQRLKEEPERMRQVKASVVLMVNGTLGAVTPKLGE